MAYKSLRTFTVSLCLGLISACGGKPAGTPISGAQSLEIVELRPGDGAAIAAGQKAVVQYTGWLYQASAPEHKGKQFDSSLGTGQPFRFTVGGGEVIKGWDQGVAGMKIGGRRRLIIPADLAYGDSGAGGVIPPGATLVFDVDLVAIE
jgi:FKBP-type peptidyl-prolyl cis-trans isomerase FkpA